jgi:hypothetical protein
MLRIEPRLAFINGVSLANRVLIFCFQLLAVYVLLVHNCGECHIFLILLLQTSLLDWESWKINVKIGLEPLMGPPWGAKKRQKSVIH